MRLVELRTFLYLSLDVTANCISKIHCLAQDGFDLNTVHKLSRKEKESWRSKDLSQGLLGGKQECFFFTNQPPPPSSGT